jgi:hypothetical protein
LISEWDTLYGRNMPRELVRRARDNLDAQGPAYERPSDWVHRFSYLRGLDGSLPGQGGGGTARDAAGNGGFIGDSREPGFGDDQLDYLTRVADAMEDLNRRLWTEDGRRERIGAIGILGNDFYDKLLILRALRARFPDAVFFTTDLDARFVDPAYSTWTRNLVVASAYGLSPMPGSPMASPVFRDSYQTSKFLATLAAVGGKEVLSFSSCADGDEALAPRLFEIGRTRVFPLALPDSRGVTSRICMTRSQALSAGVSPAARIRGDSPSRTMFVLFAAVLLMAFLSMPQFRRKILSMHGLAGIALLALSGALLFLCWGLPFDGQRLEPFSWTEGVSIWPTLLARIFVGFLIFELLRRTWKGIRESEERLGESDPDFEAIRRELTQRARERRGLWPRRSKRLTQSKDQEQAGLVRAWHWLATRPQAPRAGLRRWVLSLRDGSPRRREFSADYREYLECSRLGSRLGRVVLYIALFWFLSHLLIEEFGYEVQPYRGEWAMAMDLGTEILVGGILFLGLMFFVLDAVRLNVRLMRALRKRRPRKQGVAPVPQTDSVVGGAAASGVASPPPGAAQTGLELSDPRTREAEAVQEHESAFEDEWERISCVAQLTTPVHAFLTFPFIALFALVITKVDFLDNWHFPIANKALIGLALALIIASAISVRREAERMKRTVLARLDKVRDKLRRRSVETGVKERDLGRLERLEDRYADDVYERIRNLRAGAFHPWHQQASVQGMLWLLASLGVIGLERLLS